MTPQQSGKSWQQVISESAAMQRNIVRIHELPAFGGKRVGKGKIIPTKICCDFVGCFRETKRALFFDAKNCGQADASFNAGKHVFGEPHQLDFLRGMAEAGAVAGYLIRSERTGLIYWLKPEIIKVNDSRLPFDWMQVLGPTNQLVNFGRLSGIPHP